MANIYISKNGTWYDACDSSISKNGTWYGLSDVTSFSVMKAGVWYTNECGVPTPDFGVGFDSNLFAITIQDTGKILIGGDFTTYSGGTFNTGITKNRIIRLYSSGDVDNTFQMGTGFNGVVRSIVIDNSNRLLIGGAFTTYSGVTSNRIIRLNNDGSIDNTFQIGTGFNSTVNVITLQTNNKILVGGSFTTYSGTTKNRIIRLNENGEIDNTFGGTGFNGGLVDDIKVFNNNGSIIIGGQFGSYNGVSNNNIVKATSGGTIDTSFNSDTGFNGRVRSLLIFENDGDKILAGGEFTIYSGLTSNNRIAMLTSGGTIDTTFTPGTGFNNNVIKLTKSTDNKIYVGGGFTIYSGMSNINRIVKLNLDATIDNTFITGSGFDTSNVNAMTNDSSNRLYVGGGFNTYSGISVYGIVKLNTNGDLLSLS